MVTIAGGKLLFNTFTAGGQLEGSLPIDGAADASLTRFELRLPRSLLSERGVEDKHGLRVGLGMGGRHVPAQGRTVTFTFSNLSIAEDQPGVGRTFRVRLAAAAGGGPVALNGSRRQPQLNQRPKTARGRQTFGLVLWT